MGASFPHEPQAVDDPVVQIDQLLFRKSIDVDAHGGFQQAANFYPMCVMIRSANWLLVAPSLSVYPANWRAMS